jgi:hypothetical protein
MILSYKCSCCNRVYKKLKGNFNKKTKYSRGYDYNCKICSREKVNAAVAKYTQEKKEELRIINRNYKRDARLEGRYDKTRIAYLPRRRELNSIAKFKSIGDRMSQKMNFVEEFTGWMNSQERLSMINIGLIIDNKREFITNKILKRYE